ncbi:MAG TPA: hypothetical protein VMX17_01595 [Candidatus Glassbacteria bacterium]|nr:hypothetical protein [Candidatus Glassbacteria bacterium]
MKIWILITLFSLLAWIIYWIPSSIDRLFGLNGTSWSIILQNGRWMYMIMELSGAVGMLVRLIGVIFGILSIFFLIRNTRKFFEVKKWVVSALFLESIYYFLLLPSGLYMIGIGSNRGIFERSLASILMGIDYLLLVLFTGPFLLILGIKLFKYRVGSKGFEAWKWVSIAFVGYIASLWVNSVFKWIDMTVAEGFSVFFNGVRSLGALNAFILMSLALVFSVFAAFSLMKKDFSSSFKWLGITLVMVGLHYLINVAYSYLVGMEAYLMMAEIWAIPLLGLGLNMLRKKID